MAYHLFVHGFLAYHCVCSSPIIFFGTVVDNRAHHVLWAKDEDAMGRHPSVVSHVYYLWRPHARGSRFGRHASTGHFTCDSFRGGHIRGIFGQTIDFFSSENEKPDCESHEPDCESHGQRKEYVRFRFLIKISI